MSSTVLCAFILLACTLKFSAAQTSCRGRCGAEYYRGYMCQCDYNCLSYGECCKDYESQCTTKNSCKGRCGENFKRGRLCSCDSECVKYKQCCPDYNNHCDAEEQISGEASATASKKTSSCNNVNDNKLKDQTLNEATDQQSTYSEGNDPDDSSVPLVSPTSHPPDDLTDDMHDQIFTSDEFSKSGLEDLEASPVPEISSGYELSTADLLGQVSTEPTVTKAVTPSDDVTTAEAPNESTDASDTAFPLFTTAADHSYGQPTSNLVPLVESTASTSSPELESRRPGDADLTDVTLPSDELDVSTALRDNQDSVTDLDNLIVTTTPSSSTPDSTTILEEPTSHPLEDVTLSALADAEDPSTSSSPLGSKELSELEPVTAHVPSSTAAVQDDTTHGVTTDNLLADTLKPTSTQKPEPTTVSLDKPDPSKLDPAKPPSKPETKPLETLNIDDARDYQADDSNDTNLCSGRPVSGVTTLSNGTMVVFRGHYFWLLDRNRVPSPPRGITQVWGVPSPIDTVFTRCNCQGKTYIFKGNQYWRFENDALDPGYPRVITTGFDGLRGHITAALSVPQYKTRSESVYFFKRGGLVQKYSYQAGTSPTCGRKPHYAIYTVHNRVTRQAAPVLGPAINIRTSWRGFPSTITAAVSVPSVRDPEGYKYYVFSRAKSYSVRMDGERPAIAAPTANASPQTNNFFRCPKKI